MRCSSVLHPPASLSSRTLHRSSSCLRRSLSQVSLRSLSRPNPPLLLVQRFPLLTPRSEPLPLPVLQVFRNPSLTSPSRLPCSSLRRFATAKNGPSPPLPSSDSPAVDIDSLKEEMFMGPEERARAKEAKLAQRYANNDQPLFYPIGIPRLIVMSLLTFGIYDFIWFYRQWKTFAAATKINIWPLARTFLVWLYFHSLAKRVEYFCATHGLQKPKPLSLTVVFLVISALWLRPLTWIPLVALQTRMNEFNALTAQKAPKNTKFTPLELAYLVMLTAIVGVQLAMGV